MSKSFNMREIDNDYYFSSELVTVVSGDVDLATNLGVRPANFNNLIEEKDDVLNIDLLGKNYISSTLIDSFPDEVIIAMSGFDNVKVIIYDEESNAMEVKDMSDYIYETRDFNYIL